MNINAALRGPTVSLADILDARERRVMYQQRLLEERPAALISFTMNIPGPIKVFPLMEQGFEEGMTLIPLQCRAAGIVLQPPVKFTEPTGWLCFFRSDAPAEAVKKAVCLLEESSDLGRLFDIDVLRPDGTKVSRSEVGMEERKCLLCSQPAFLCGRARAHTVPQLQEAVVNILWNYFSRAYARRVGDTAARALLYEVLATPKPGLVDKANNGAHHDMDLTTFVSSTLALHPHLENYTAYGIAHCEDAPETFLQDLRPMGMTAEMDMFRATGGVNTHKGMVFSMGILCAALGFCYGRQEPATPQRLKEVCMEIAIPLKADFPQMEGVTNGSKVFQTHGITGARGEALAGYATVFDIALPRMKQLLQEGFSRNDAGILTLVTILAHVEDTNLIHRGSLARSIQIREQLRALEQSVPEHQDYQRILTQLDRSWSAEGLSPGGSADVLALTYFLLLLDLDAADSV